MGKHVALSRRAMSSKVHRCRPCTCSGHSRVNSDRSQVRSVQVRGQGSGEPELKARSGLGEAGTVYQKCQGAAATSELRADPNADTDRNADVTL